MEMLNIQRKISIKKTDDFLTIDIQTVDESFLFGSFKCKLRIFKTKHCIIVKMCNESSTIINYNERIVFELRFKYEFHILLSKKKMLFLFDKRYL